jgi:hypothetical protein
LCEWRGGHARDGGGGGVFQPSMRVSGLRVIRFTEQDRLIGSVSLNPFQKFAARALVRSAVLAASLSALHELEMNLK